jgi:PAS domain S-box-containing protein
VTAGTYPKDAEIQRLRAELADAHAALTREIAGRPHAEEMLRALVDGIPGFVAILGPEGNVEVVNRQIMTYCGKTLEEMRDWGNIGIVHEDDALRNAAIFLEAIAHGVPYDHEIRLRRFDGAYRWFSNRGVPIMGEPGEVVRWYVLLTDIDDRKRAEERLAASERNLRLTIDSISTLVVCNSGTDGSHEFANRPWHAYTGLSPAEARTRWQETLHPEDAQRLIKAWWKMVKTGEGGEIEGRMRRFDGIYRWHLFRSAPLRDDAGNVIRFYTASTDIEDRKTAEEALIASERGLRQTIDTIPAVVFCNSAEGPNEFLNKRWHDYTGIPPEETAGSGWQAPVHPDDLPRMMTAWLGMLERNEGGEVEGRMRRFDGVYRRFLFRTEPLRDKGGKIVKWYGTVNDIEDRKQAEDELKRSEAFLVQGEAVSETGSFLWKPGSDEIVWSKQLQRIFELEPATPVTVERAMGRIHPQDARKTAAMLGRAQDGVAFDDEQRLLLPDGSIKYLHFVAQPMRDAEGRLEYMGTIQDITDRKLAEQEHDRVRSELAHAARAMSLGVLTASLAHEVNQPLAGIITNANTCLRMLSADPPNVKGALETARRTIRDGNRASEVVSRLRTLFSKKEFATETVDLTDAAREVLALSAH